MSESGLLMREQGVNNGFYTSVDQLLENLLGDTEQRDRLGALCVLYRFLLRLRDCDYKSCFREFGNSELAQAGKKETT